MNYHFTTYEIALVPNSLPLDGRNAVLLSVTQQGGAMLVGVFGDPVVLLVSTSAYAGQWVYQPGKSQFWRQAPEKPYALIRAAAKN
jgi:hypothetical protein